MYLSFFHQQLQFSRSFTKRLNERLVEIGLYQSQWLIVYYLKHRGAATLVEISQYIDVEKPTISRTVNRLEQTQLVEKIPSQDKRERKIQLTEKGIQVFQEANRVVEAFEQEVLAGVSEADLAVTLQTIQLLKEKLK